MQSLLEIKNNLEHAKKLGLNLWLQEKGIPGRILVLDAKQNEDNIQVLISGFQGKVWINLRNSDKLLIK